jgi:hypothetical protein
MYSDKTVPVKGVGTVVLPVRKALHRTGSAGHGQLILQDVLHIPDSVCNVVGLPETFLSQYPIITLGGVQSSIQDANGRPIALFDESKRLSQIKLSGPPVGPVVGPSSMVGNCAYMINVRWSNEEWARWEAHKQAQDNSTYGGFDQENSSESRQNKSRARSERYNAPYNTEEKRWLKTHFKGEFHFLRAHGLSIYKRKDREEGRAILRAIMSEQISDTEESISDHIEGTDETSDEDGEEYFQSHMADYHFDEEALNWINKYHGNSMRFMMAYGLKFYSNDDCEQAKIIVKAMMGSD